LPAMPEIMNSGHRVELKAVQGLSPGLLQRILSGRTARGRKENSARK
jgi:hypothetical protein